MQHHPQLNLFHSRLLFQQIDFNFNRMFLSFLLPVTMVVIHFKFYNVKEFIFFSLTLKFYMKFLAKIDIIR